MEDKNLLLRVSISVIVIALTIWFNAFATDCKTKKECEYIEKHKKQIETVENKYKHLENNKANVNINKLLPDKETLKGLYNKYKGLTKNRADVSKYEEFGKAINWNALLNMYGSNWLEMNKNLQEKLKPQKKKQIIFYLFSTTVPKQTIVNVLKSAKKYKYIEVIPVIRGLNRKEKKPVEKYIWAYMNDINNKVGGNITVKINPIIFIKAEVNLVPAFVLANCPVYYGIIRSRECNYKAVIYGDTSLDFVLERFKEAGYLQDEKMD